MAVELLSALEDEVAGANDVFLGPFKCVLIDILLDGSLLVAANNGDIWCCDWLEHANSISLCVSIGDVVLALKSTDAERGVVMGRIGQYKAPSPQKDVMVEAAESLSLKCGNASLELRANGQVLIKGEDVTLRAKGTQAIRAGNVSIN